MGLLNLFLGLCAAAREPFDIASRSPAGAAAGWEPRMGLLNLFLGLRCAAACVPSSASAKKADGNILVRALSVLLLC
jgi:hypothetical protein